MVFDYQAILFSTHNYSASVQLLVTMINVPLSEERAAVLKVIESTLNSVIIREFAMVLSVQLSRYGNNMVYVFSDSTK